MAVPRFHLRTLMLLVALAALLVAGAIHLASLPPPELRYQPLLFPDAHF